LATPDARRLSPRQRRQALALKRALDAVVCPVFNEEKTVPLFSARLAAAIKAVEDKVRFELLFVDNRSTDTTREAIAALQATDPRIQLLTMSRNFGYQASITAGMKHAHGDAIMNIDVDCEDPPEMLPKFIEEWLGGADVAYGIRSQREEFVLMHLARKAFYRLIRAISDHEIVLDMAEFFLVDKRVREKVLSTKSTVPFVRGQVGYVGFKRVGIPYKRERRITGQTHYNLISAISFGMAGILSSSTLALRLLAYVGVVAFLLDLAGGVAVVALGGEVGLTTGQRLIVGFLALQLGWMMLAFGAIGLYLARVYKNTVGLPLYIVDEKIGTDRHAR
jgi:dolichol-phosphate mannosyltransferase